MIDFARSKMLFALAMAGILFAVHPLVRDHGAAGFEFFGILVPFVALYYTFLALLGCTVYFYALDCLQETPMGLGHRVGNLFYAMSLLFPPVFAVVALGATVAEGVVWISDSAMAGEISKFVVLLTAGFGGVLLARVLWVRMNTRERETSADNLAVEARAHLRRADELVEARHYDLVALEAFRAIEASLQHTLLANQVSISSSRANLLIPTASKAGIIPEELVGILHELRVARNRAVHGADQFTRHDATWFLATTRTAMKKISAPVDGEPEEGVAADLVPEVS